MWADGYFQGVANAEIGAGETQTLTLELQPGQPRWGWCCYAYDRAEATAGGPVMAEDGAAPSNGDEASADGGQQGVRATGGQDASFRGSGGGLGPYPGASDTGTPEDPDQSTPVPGALAVLVLLGLGAVGLRVWRPKP